MASQNKQNKTITYRLLSASDINDVVCLHERLIPSAGARMGTPYLYRLYTSLIKHPAIHAVLGAFKDNTLVGFISVTKNIRETENILNLQKLKLIPAVILGLIRRQYSLNELYSHAQVSSHIKRLFGVSTVYIYGIAVDPRLQRHGIATHLIEQMYTRWNTKTILIDTQKNNTVAQNFYKKTGFVPVTIAFDSIIFRFEKR